METPWPGPSRGGKSLRGPEDEIGVQRTLRSRRGAGELDVTEKAPEPDHAPVGKLESLPPVLVL